METVNEIIIKFLSEEDNSQLVAMHCLITGVPVVDAITKAIDGDTDNPEIFEIITINLKKQIIDNV